MGSHRCLLIRCRRNAAMHTPTKTKRYLRAEWSERDWSLAAALPYPCVCEPDLLRPREAPGPFAVLQHNAMHLRQRATIPPTCRCVAEALPALIVQEQQPLGPIFTSPRRCRPLQRGGGDATRRAWQPRKNALLLLKTPSIFALCRHKRPLANHGCACQTYPAAYPRIHDLPRPRHLHANNAGDNSALAGSGRVRARTVPGGGWVAPAGEKQSGHGPGGARERVNAPDALSSVVELHWRGVIITSASTHMTICVAHILRYL